MFDYEIGRYRVGIQIPTRLACLPVNATMSTFDNHDTLLRTHRGCTYWAPFTLNYHHRLGICETRKLLT